MDNIDSLLLNYGDILLIYRMWKLVYVFPIHKGKIPLKAFLLKGEGIDWVPSLRRAGKH